MASGNATEYRHKDKIVEIIDESKAKINRLFLAIRTADEQEREVLYEQIADIKAERDKQVAFMRRLSITRYSRNCYGNYMTEQRKK